MTLTDI
jgi:hypothetical protein